MSQILIVDDDTASCRTLELHYRGQGHKVHLAHTVTEGLTAASVASPDLVILDIRMPGRSGLEGLPDFKERLPDVPVIMITAFHDMESTIDAMKGGADDYIHKPIDIDELDDAVAGALTRTTPDSDDVRFGSRDSRQGRGTMVGRSRPMKEVFKTIGLVAQKPVTILITDDSGTGKELVARAIHEAGLNPTAPFVAVNCAALVETLLESDLFGHEKGAFTGAISRQPGKFALANDGTIFLDEIGELSPSIQAKLLRVLQAYDWPGNVRELENVLMKAVALCPGDTITRELLPDCIWAAGPHGRPCTEKPLEQMSLMDVQRQHVARVLDATHWHRGRTCEILGVSRPRLRRLIAQYDLTPPGGDLGASHLHTDDENR